MTAGELVAHAESIRRLIDELDDVLDPDDNSDPHAALVELAAIADALAGHR